MGRFCDMLEKIQNRVIQSRTSIYAALKKMDELHVKLLFVYEDHTFQSLLSIGDIQRAILSNTPLTTDISKILRSDYVMAGTDESFEQIRQKMLRIRTECMPVVDPQGNIVDVVFWDDLFADKDLSVSAGFDLPIVIMAGGFGTRLQPITNVLPKPLIPISQKTIIEDIMDRFIKHGSRNFYVSVNYKAEFIKEYLSKLDPETYRITYFQEDKPLGTAGSLFLLKNSLKTTFFVSNCDSIIDQDYAEILDYHRKNENEITIVSSVKDYSIPYGVLLTGKDGKLQSILEKPDYFYQINTGLYILEPHLLDEIPENSFFHITHLIEKLISSNRKVGVFPVSEKSWIDIGDWKEYLKIING